MSNTNQIALLASMGALVVTEKDIVEDGDKNRRYIHLKGRRPGLISALMSHLGLDSTTTFDVYEDRIEFSTTSLSGHIDELIPLTAVCNLGTGYVKPVSMVIMAISFLLIGLFVSIDTHWIVAVLGLVLATIFIVTYCLSRTVLIYVRTVGADIDMISFKKSVVEGVSMNPEEAARIIAIMSKLVQKAAAKNESVIS